MACEVTLLRRTIIRLLLLVLTLLAVFGFDYKKLNAVIPKNRFGDKLYSFILFVARHKRLPSNKNIFNDVIYKIKTTDEIINPLRVFISDKEYAKLYVRAIVGEKYSVPTIAVLKNKQEIDLYDFPSTCCIKPTHASGSVILRRDNVPIDKNEIKNWFLINYYNDGREANYKTLQPKVIVEQLIFDGVNICDYKFFCFNGVAKLVQVDVDRFAGHKRMLFDKDWNQQDYSIFYQKSADIIVKPDNYEEMLEVAQRLAAGFGFIRIDLYSDGKRCLVGEITNCHGNAGENFIPLSGEIKASEIIFG